MICSVCGTQSDYDVGSARADIGARCAAGTCGGKSDNKSYSNRCAVGSVFTETKD